MPDLSHERALAEGGLPVVAGLDEVGRGPWAGPVVACAAILPDLLHPTAGLPPALYAALNDSKKLSPAARDALAEALPEVVQAGFGEASVAEIDTLNILQASLLAMRRALVALPLRPAAALVDGNRDPGFDLPTRLIVKGDAISASIAAASILAKVRRDRIMAALSRDYPGFGWETNAGYGTKAHRAGLDRFGVTPHHRASFAPIRARLQGALKI